MIVQSVYAALALTACAGSMGLYDMLFVDDFYIYFTNLSNYLCASIMIAELIQTARKKTDGYVTIAPRLRVISMLGLMLTFLVFNILLANDPGRAPALNYKVECILLHIVLPVMYVADWVMFYEHGRVNWKVPLQSALLPLVYLLYIFLRAVLLQFGSGTMDNAGAGTTVYPYFFLDPGQMGMGGVFIWVFAMAAGFIVLGYLVMIVDHLLGKRLQNRPAE